MVRPLSNPPEFAGSEHDSHVVQFPTRPAARVPAQASVERPLHSDDPPFSLVPLVAVPGIRIRTHAIRQVVVLEVAGPLSDVVKDLDRAIQHALAVGPRGVVCNLSAALEDAEPSEVAALATAGRHVRDWSGIPVAVACPNSDVRALLTAHPMGGHLIVTESMLPALSAVLETVTLTRGLRLPAHPTALRAAREFVTRAVVEWGLDLLVHAANLVITELVNTSMDTDTETEIHLTVGWSLGALRLTVRDSSPDLQRRRYNEYGLRRREPNAVAALSRAFGVLPTAEGGKVVWAVLNASRTSD